MTKWKQWSANTSQIAEVQDTLDKTIELFINSFFKISGEYVQEKFVKTFSELIRYLEHTLRLQKGIAPEQMREFITSQSPDTYLLLEKEVKDILLSEIDRQKRHYNIFLPGVTHQ